MLMSPDIAECLDALCADSNLPLLKLAEAQNYRESGVMAPLIERSETVADAVQVVPMFNCNKPTLQCSFERELSCRFSDLVDDVRAEMCLPLLESRVCPMQAIAKQLGYATSRNFSRFFQRRFGCTPRDWMRLAITA